MESSDRLQRTNLVVVENTFNRATFERGKIYSLNTQKLGKKSLLVRGFEGYENGQLFETRPDLHSNIIWDTIRNTIEDPTLKGRAIFPVMSGSEVLASCIGERLTKTVPALR